MCNGLIIYNGDKVEHELHTLRDAVKVFGEDIVKKCYNGEVDNRPLDCCLCPLNFDAICAEADYERIQLQDQRYTVFDTAIEPIGANRDGCNM